MDHLLPPGLGKDAHIQRALAAANPFGMGQPADPDLQFAAEALACFGTQIGEWREIERKGLEDTLAALTPLREALSPWRSPTALAVAPHRDVAGIAFFTAILRWPDRAQARGYLEGFRVVGEIPSSKVFRQTIPQAVTCIDSDFFGEAARLEVNTVLSSPPPRD